MEDKVRIDKFDNLINALENGESFSLINIVNRDKTDKVIREMLTTVLKTGDIRNLDYEFDGGNINLAYKSAEELVYSLELKKEYPVINLYKATGSLSPMIIYRENQTLSCDLENKKLIFDNFGQKLYFDITSNVYSTSINTCVEICKYKLSPDPEVIIENLKEILD